MRSLLLMCALIGCEHASTTSDPDPTPTPTPTPAPTPDAPPADASPPDAPAYPVDAIREAEAAIRKACGGLVYKDGCRKLRHGRIEVAVSLDTAGAQTRVDTIENTTTPDGALVLRCVKKALENHMFPAPASATTLAIAFRLADKC